MHEYQPGPDGRCVARPLGAGHFPICDQWPGNDVHLPVSLVGFAKPDKEHAAMTYRGPDQEPREEHDREADEWRLRKHLRTCAECAWSDDDTADLAVELRRAAWSIGDRLMEALLGARLRFQAGAMTRQQAERTYRRWSQLYHQPEEAAARDRRADIEHSIAPIR